MSNLTELTGLATKALGVSTYHYVLVGKVINTLYGHNLLQSPEGVCRGDKAINLCLDYLAFFEERVPNLQHERGQDKRVLALIKFAREERRRREPARAPLDEVLHLWSQCDHKLPGPLTDALNRLAAERS